MAIVSFLFMESIKVKVSKAARIGLMVSVLFVVGCSGLKTRRDLRKQVSKTEEGTQTTLDSPEEKEPLSQNQRGFQEEPLPPTPPPMNKFIKLPKVGLLLGPGGAKALAHSGVIKSLLQQRIPINYVVGLEWGAVVGGLYAHEGKIHDVEWKLYKLKAEDIVNRSLFSSKVSANSVDQLSGFMEESFERNQLNQSAIRFSCPTLHLKTAQMSWISGGTYREAMNRCLPYPPLFKSYRSYLAAAFSYQEAVQFLRQKGVELIVVVDVLSEQSQFSNSFPEGEEAAQLLSIELQRHWRGQENGTFKESGIAIEWIQIDTSKYSFGDFEKKRSIMAMGERAGLRRGKMIAEKYGF